MIEHHSETHDAVSAKTRTDIERILRANSARLMALPKSLEAIAFDKSRDRHRSLKIAVGDDTYEFMLSDEVSVVMRQAMHPLTEVQMIRGQRAHVRYRPDVG